MNKERKSAWSSPVRLVFSVGLAFCLLAEARAQSLLATNGNFLAWPDTEVPGLPGVYFGGTVEWPTAAEDGTVFFRSDLYGEGTSQANSRALFTGQNAANLSMVARWSDPAPGLPGVSLINASGTQGPHHCSIISPSGGYLLWSSYLSGAGVTTTSDTALFGRSSGGDFVIAREGDPAPGTAGAVFAGNLLSNYQFTQVNRNGTVLFQASLAGGDVTPTNYGALYTGTPGALSIVLRLGDTVLPGPVTVSGIGYVQHLDNAGRAMFDVLLAGPGVTVANNNSLWFYTPGSGSTLLVREGDPAPGTAGATFGATNNSWYPGVSVTSLTRGGRYEFTTTLIGGDVIPGINDRALYAGSVGGGLTMVARSGDPAPGTDAYFLGFSSYYSLINDAGSLAFQAQLTGGTADETNDTGIWLKTAESLTLILREGDPVPGAPGSTWDYFMGWNMSFNDLGQIFIQGNLLGGEVVPGFNDREYLIWDPVKGLILVARSGEDIEGAPGSVRTLGGIGFLQYSNTDGVSHALGKDGRLAIAVYFIDGSAVATVDLNCYPPTKHWVDADGDGYGDALGTPLSVCANATAPAGYVPNATDCDDANPNVYTIYYQDADGDGYGNASASVCGGATPPTGSVANDTDCNDANPTAHPGASDANCDAVDSDCNGAVDDGYVSEPTTCGVGPCARSGATACVNGAVIDSCVPGTPSPETCNGIDDNCDTLVDNVAAPTGTPDVVLEGLGSGSARLTWSSVAAATGYDLVRGSLQGLRSSGGNYSVATTDCLDNDLAATTADDAAVPAGSQGFWYLVRAANCGGSASYDSGSPSQVGSRDAGIAASGQACP